MDISDNVDKFCLCKRKKSIKTTTFLVKGRQVERNCKAKDTQKIIIRGAGEGKKLLSNFY